MENNKSTLSIDQQQRIEATLARIREGLEASINLLFAEPAHCFNPEAYDVSNQ